MRILKKGTHLEFGVDSEDGIGAAIGPDLALGQHRQVEYVRPGQLRMQQRIYLYDTRSRLGRRFQRAVAHQVCADTQPAMSTRV